MPRRCAPRNDVGGVVVFREKSSHDLLDETIVIISAELVNFNKSEEECESRLDRMLYLLKNSGRLLMPPSWSDRERYSQILAAKLMVLGVAVEIIFKVK